MTSSFRFTPGGTAAIAQSGTTAMRWSPSQSPFCFSLAATNLSKARAWSHKAAKLSIIPSRPRTAPSARKFLDRDPPPAQLGDICLERNRLVGGMHALEADSAIRLHLTRDRQRIPGGAHHSTDAMNAVVIVHEAELHLGRLPALLTTDLDLKRDEVLALGLV